MPKPIADQIIEFRDCWVDLPHLKQVLISSQWAFKASGTSAVGMMICGPSGAGKSATKDHIHRQIIKANTPEQEHYPIVSLKLRHRALVEDVKRLMLEFLGIEDVSKIKRRDLDKLLYKQLAQCGTKLVIFDEFQTLLRNKNRDINEDVCNFIKELIEVANISVLLFGLETGAKILKMDDQLKTRFGQPVYLPTFTLDQDGSVQYYAAFLDKLLKQYPRKTANLTKPENAKRILMATDGNLRELKKLLITVMQDTQSSPDKPISVKHLADSYRRYMPDPPYLGTNGRRIHPFKSTDEIVHRYLYDELGVK